MIEIKDKAKCCGCSACRNACPKSCIDMIADHEGFLYPQVRKDECIACGVCERVCHLLHDDKKIPAFPALFMPRIIRRTMRCCKRALPVECFGRLQNI